MPAAQSPTTRARDLDRSAVCAVLDTAYADGQLDKIEHGARTTAAMAAKTLGELRALADDLQVEQALPPLRTPRPPGSPSRRRRITTGLVASLLFLGAGFGIGYASGTSGSPTAGAGDDVAPVVVGLQGLHSRDGFAALVAAVGSRFGSAMVAEAVVYPEYAVITMPAPGAPGRAQSFLYRGGFDEPSNAGTRTASDPLVDLAAVRVDAILGLVAGAGESLAVADPTSRYLIIGQNGGSPYVSVYASNEFNESGYVRAGLDGTVTAVHPYEAG
ncbi:DUF1707 SHOCT-like domain-containing protein [Pseudonocardia broussonetiae]|uniref:DUF1707 domain-containing protein n=1 Tax=Pseudonocardia broussonetiae TaxID=2736640 RepID=A0A6M6JDJ8_9PSEU|nr:DUF1707 domain-containing protein [Pseudonocardia broussonetiae]QJY44561.1 DUF1707 domain-containing protein [Pseudonocardia broussonetiae]